MAGIVEIYTEAVHKHLAPLYANWEPGRSIRVGAVGTLNGKIFLPESHLEDRGIPVTTKFNETSYHRTFTSEESVQVTTGGSVSSAGIDASGFIDVALAKAGSIFFNAAGCNWLSIERKRDLANAVMELYRQGIWKAHWVVATDIVEAKFVAIAVAGGTNANLRLKARGRGGPIELADASLNLGVASETLIGYRFVGNENTLLLLGLAKIQRRWLVGPPELRTLCLLDPDMDELLDPDDNELFFGQLS